MPFPMIKLGYLAFKQVSKPISRWIQVKAKNNKFVRNYFCIPPAQLYHWYDTAFTKRGLNLQVGTIKQLPEEEAVQLGAEIISELLLFGVAVGVMLYEYVRGYQKDIAKAKALEFRFLNIERKAREMDIELDQIDARLRHCERENTSSDEGLVAHILNSVKPKKSEEHTTEGGKDQGKPGGKERGPKSNDERLNHVETRQIELLITLNSLDKRLQELQTTIDEVQASVETPVVSTLLKPAKSK